MKKKNRFVILIMSLLLVFPHATSAEQTITGGCVQPSNGEIDRMLTSEALKHDVPPEIVKAIAFVEAFGWVHCEDGETIISGDGGIGIMQVTDPENEYNLDEERLHTDIAYNISAGVSILNDKFGYSGSVIPLMNDGDRDKLENWYFAVMAYNGLVQKNSPRLKKDGSRNTNTYQDKVFHWIYENNLELPLNLGLDEVLLEDLIYRDNGTIGFRKLSYNTGGPLQSTRHKFEKNDLVVVTAGASLRELPFSKSNPKGKAEREVVTIEDAFSFDQSNNNYNHFVWYPIVTKNQSNSGFVASPYLAPFGKRISGPDRFETAIEISKQGWDKAETVILARSEDFPDALAGAPLAYKLNAPILLTKQSSLNEKTKARIIELGAKKVIILGGKSAVSDNVESSLKKAGVAIVDRIGGATRYETARLIAEELGGNPEKAIVAYGKNFPDALAIAPYAAKNGYPILLTDTSSLNSSTAKAIAESKIGKAIVVGGTAAVSDKTFSQLPNGSIRIRGANRYATSVEIINQLNMPTDIIYNATGQNFADALTGSVLAAKKNSSILLIDDQVRPEITNLIRSKKLDTFHVLGGRGAVSDKAVNNLLK
ncbi:putative cell wall-binding protein [Bacillus tianshenii]|uniref:Cell wall-binding protein n=1 Tax=Sutcliffiella tianshenii TaxID=1463404 RepID=A0ABS2NUZ7_9BACI|nr:cell wall-binding repeat-containing protein [Bacillus tianshenii]MBM7618427.1 putative cell wall-binding protein [Bacillus tianshenii]